MVKDVSSRFLQLVVKLAKATIWSSSLLEPIRHLNSILKNQPSESFVFWRDPRLPYKSSSIAISAFQNTKKVRKTIQKHMLSTQKGDSSNS
jgi:hypothetical protein